MRRLARRAGGIRATIETREAFCKPEEELGPLRGCARLRKEGLIGVDRRLPSASGELEVRLQSGPPFGFVLEEAAGRLGQPLSEEAERDHRGLAVTGLERADIRLGVAAGGELLLGQAGGKPSLADAKPDPARQLSAR